MLGLGSHAKVSGRGGVLAMELERRESRGRIYWPGVETGKVGVRQASSETGQVQRGRHPGKLWSCQF